MFSLELPHRGGSNEYTQYTIFNMNKKNTLNYLKSAAMGFFSNGLKNEFETAVVNEPSVFDLLNFYYICIVFAVHSWPNTFFFVAAQTFKNPGPVIYFRVKEQDL